MPTAIEQGTSKAVPIFGIGNQARSPFISSTDLVNAVVEPTENGRQPVAIIGLPGLIQMAAFSPLTARAIFSRDGEQIFYIVAGSELLKVSQGSTEKISTLGSSEGPAWMDDNGIQLFVNDGVSPLIYTFATQTVTPITDIDFPAGARGAVYLQGRFWVHVPSGEKAGRCYASDIKNGLAWDSLNFIEPSAKPDSIVGIVRHADDLMIIGSGSVEWWSSAPSAIAGALGFQPSAPANTEVGGLSSEGYAKAGQSLFFVGHSDGDPMVYRVNGYALEEIEAPAVDQDTETLSFSSAICTGYTVSGHQLFQLTIPHVDADKAKTWVYDVQSKQWTRRMSDGVPYYRGRIALGAVGDTYITDAFTGILYKMQDGHYDENGALLPFTITSQHILKEGDHVTIHAIQIDMETGLGNTAMPDFHPHGILRVSKDGGRTWAIERHLALGKVGSYRTRARATQFGVARDFAIEFTITDPIPRRVTGAYLTMDPNYA